MSAAQPKDRKIAEDNALPIPVESDLEQAEPPSWKWRRTSASQPSKAIFHVNHSDVSPAMPRTLRPSDSPPDAPFVLKQDIPILIMDSLDKYWAGENRQRFHLNGVRVAVEGDTIEQAKRNLAADLSAQCRLLTLLSVSHKGQIAPQLQENLNLLRQYLMPNPNLRQ